MIRIPASFVARALLVLVAAILTGTGLVRAQLMDMRGTAHNLANGANLDTTDSRQLCVFCHTPADAELGEAAQPLWQPSAPEDQRFLMFDDIGQQGQEGNDSVGSQSIACLSCHDSSQAFGIDGGSRDHPFAVPYRGALSAEERQRAREEARIAGRLINQGQFVRSGEGFREASRGIVDNRPVWWVSQGGPTAQRGRFDVPLYVRIDEEDQTEIPFIECASCHDPHNVQPMFLRADADTSNLCLTCHAK